MKSLTAYRLPGTNTPLVHVLMLVAAGLTVYSNTFSVPFLFDDIRNILENSLVRDIGQFSDPSAFLNNRPLGFLSFALNYRLNGLDTAGYHVVNTAIHIANSLLVYRLVLSVFETPPLPGRSGSDSDRKSVCTLALAVSALFVCHPLQTGAVTYIVQRFTLLATLFYLLSLVTYLAARCRLSAHGQWRSTRFLGLYSISLLSALFAMKCKEIAFTLPVMIVIAELLFFDARPKERLCLLLPFLATMAVIPLSMLLSGTHSGGLFHQAAEVTRTTTSVSRSDYLLSQPRVLVTYIRLLLLPVGQNIDYDYPVYQKFLQLPVLVPLALHAMTIALAGALWRFSREENRPARVIAFGILWFYVTLAVESSIIPLDDVIFEHRLYLPSVGFLLVPAACFHIFREKAGRVPAAAGWALIAFAALLLAGAAFKRNAVWQSGVSIWQDAVHKSPLKSKPHYNLGYYLANSGEVEAAIREFRAAVRLDPANGKAHNNLGANLVRTGDIRAAIHEFREAVRVDPINATARFNLGYALAEIGEADAAIAELQKGLQLDPADSTAQNQLLRLVERAK